MKLQQDQNHSIIPDIPDVGNIEKILEPSELSSIKMVNRVDRLTLNKIDLQRVQQYTTKNKHMNSFVLRIPYNAGKLTLQIFFSTKTAMCFTSNICLNEMYDLFLLLSKEYGIDVKTCFLCTTVWTFSLLSKIGDMGKFYKHCVSQHPKLSISYEPELFQCVTMVVEKATIRIFHTGKVIILGIQHVNQLTCPYSVITSIFFDYSITCNFGNF